MDLLTKIINAGVVGAGGAGFPTHVKYNVQTEWFILNAVECEPLIYSDKYLIRERANDIITTMEIIAKHIGATKLAIGIKKTYSQELDILRKVIGSRPIKIVEMESFYPAGDEQVMIYEITGTRVPLRKLPKDIGITVSNVSTVCDVADAIQDYTKTHKILSVVGEVESPSLIKVPIGMPVLEILQSLGVKVAEFSVLIGGPMMGRIFCGEELQNLSVTKTTNSIIVLPRNHYLEQNQNIPTKHMINQTLSACIQCRECTELCPRFLIGHPLHPHRIMRSIAFGDIESKSVFEEALLCCECGVCDYVCPMNLSPRRVNQMVKKQLAGKKINQGELRDPVENRNYRRLPTSRLIYMLDIQNYNYKISSTLISLDTETVIIPLKQHIGKESIPVVTMGDSVQQGQLIAQIPENALGANIHASISGNILEITSNVIIIKSSKGSFQ